MEASDRRAHIVATTGDRTTAWSIQLAQAHHTLRRRLRQVQWDPGTTEADGDDLATHCLAFCSALSAHHGGEDAGMFTELLRARPDLESVITNLVEDHQMKAVILKSVRVLAAEAVSAGSDRVRAIGRELDGLAAIIESHFRYEERAISPALDGGVRDKSWTPTVFDFTEK